MLRRRSRDPCGDIGSVPASFAANQALVRTIAVPILLVFGAQDALFPPPNGEAQRANAYPQSPDVSLVELPGTGHAVTLGRTHDAFRAAMGAWLAGHGY